MVSSIFHQIQNNFSNWNVLCAVLLEKQIYQSRTFNDKNRWIIKKVVVLKKLLPHLAASGTYSPGEHRGDEAWREQTLVYPPVMCQQRLIHCTWELNVMQINSANMATVESLCTVDQLIVPYIYMVIEWLFSLVFLATQPLFFKVAYNIMKIRDVMWTF